MSIFDGAPDVLDAWCVICGEQEHDYEQMTACLARLASQNERSPRQDFHRGLRDSLRGNEGVDTP